jgi:hypothetical protein
MSRVVNLSTKAEGRRQKADVRGQKKRVKYATLEYVLWILGRFLTKSIL